MSVKDNIQQDSWISTVKQDSSTHEGAIINKKVEHGIVPDLYLLTKRSNIIEFKTLPTPKNTLSSTDLKIQGDQAKLVGVVADRHKQQVYHVTCTGTAVLDRKSVV